MMCFELRYLAIESATTGANHGVERGWHTIYLISIEIIMIAWIESRSFACRGNMGVDESGN
jgi:hypothetical protein